MNPGWDVIVVGAGPAGASAARVCAERGLRTLVLDRAEFPREKPCGGGVSLAAERLLPEPLPPEVAQVRCRMLRAVHRGHRVELVYGEPFLASVRRAVLDAHLLEQAMRAGAVVRPGQAAEGLDGAAEGVSGFALEAQGGLASGLREGRDRLVPRVVRAGRERLTTRAVIVADGVTGAVSRSLVRPFARRGLALCLTAEAEMDARAEDPFRREGIEVHYAVVPMGYGWLFPKRDRMFVGLGAHLPAAGGLREAFAAFTRANRLRLLTPPRAALVPVGGVRRTLVGDGWLLVGDAAGLADPFSGEGIRYALASGELAARVLVNCLEKGKAPTASALSAYPRLLRCRFGAHLAMARVMFFLLGRFPEGLVSLYCSQVEPFRRTLDMLAGRVTYASLLRWFLPRFPLLVTAHSGKSHFQ